MSSIKRNWLQKNKNMENMQYRMILPAVLSDRLAPIGFLLCSKSSKHRRWCHGVHSFCQLIYLEIYIETIGCQLSRIFLSDLLVFLVP